ncbi:Protein CBG26199 [Caenorhabditis briggsae]|uniref:Protein CBG26199 n=1 Tax=Caenorhabditis briggsae TaxID=6238 RepID=B6ILU4_CAEBR|nr:Protein CBG26199 [Caenorhabditis briggsae]CAS00874.1 Protein CBG26199 [Caenorhabditis briggsae]
MNIYRSALSCDEKEYKIARIRANTWYSYFYPILFRTTPNFQHNGNNRSSASCFGSGKKREDTIEAKEMVNQTLMGNVIQYMKDLAENNSKVLELQAQLAIEQRTRQGRDTDMSKQIEDIKRERIETQAQIEGELRYLRKAHEDCQTTLEAEKRKVEDLKRREVDNRKRHSENLRKLWEDEENRLGSVGDEESNQVEHSSGATGEGTSHQDEERVEKQESRRKRRKAAQ